MQHRNAGPAGRPAGVPEPLAEQRAELVAHEGPGHRQEQLVAAETTDLKFDGKSPVHRDSIGTGYLRVGTYIYRLGWSQDFREHISVRISKDLIGDLKTDPIALTHG